MGCVTMPAMSPRLYIFIMLAILPGCMWPFGRPSVAPESSVAAAPGESEAIQAYVTNPDRLRQGGNVLITRFLPGENAAANGEFDEVMAMIRQGLADSFDAFGGHFQVIGPLEEGQADLVIRGVVRRLSKDGRLTRWVRLRNHGYISADIELLAADSEEKIVAFTHAQIVDLDEGAMKDLGYKMGVDIARFMGRFAKE